MRKNLWLVILLLTTKNTFAQISGECGANCIYTYSDGTLIYSVADSNANNGKGLITISNYHYGIDGVVNNIIVNDGITGVNLDHNGDHSGFENVGTANGKLILPNNFTTGTNSMYGLGFGTIEFGDNVTIGLGSFRFKEDANVTLVMSPDSNITFSDDAMAYYQTSKSPNSIHIACKGNAQTCYDKFSNVINKRNPGNVTWGYYEETDTNGNTIKYTDEGCIKYDSTGNIVGQYDLKGNIFYASDGSVYTYDKNGKLVDIRGKRIFTVDEATALVQNNKNTFTLKYR